jgi:hypothetical protein
MMLTDLRSRVHAIADARGITMDGLLKECGLTGPTFYNACKSPDCVNITTATRLMKVKDAVAPEAEFLIMGALKLYSHKPSGEAALNSKS